jgi:hypothetical protein
MRLRLPSVPPWLALVLVAPAIGEVLSGSSPPPELLNPVAVFFLIGLYGSGALLVREIAFRWGKGWPSVFALGAAYGIIEEGLMCKSFFDPGWMDVGLLGSYGRWLGVNWIWTLELILFHAAFSTSIAILLVYLAYPEKRGKPWAGNKGLILAGILMALVVVLGYFFISAYRPDILLTLLSGLAAGALIVLARLLPPGLPFKSESLVPRPRWLAMTGFTWTFALFFIVWVIPSTGLPAVLTFTLLLGLAAAGWAMLAWLYGKGAGFTEGHKLALAAGALGFFLLLSALMGIGGIRGMGLAGATAAVLLFLLWRRLERHPGALPAYGPDS